MKKITKLVITLFIIILLFELIAYITKNNHEVEYKVKTKDNSFQIKEIYKDKKYYITISDKDYIYTYELKNNFHKSKKIVTNIYTYKTKEMLCIYPVTKELTGIECSKEKKTYSYTSQKKDLEPFIKQLQEKGYKIKAWEGENNYQKTLDNLKIYSKNINDNTYIYIYKYDGFYSINSRTLEKINLFKNDTYNNTLGIQLNKYYIIPDYEQKHDYSKFYIIDMTTNKVKNKTYKKSISKDSYINGIINNEIYIFDKDELIQYKIYKKGNKIKEVGNKENGALYYNLKFETKDVYSFRDENLKFKTFNDYISEIEKNTNLKYLRNKDDSYYYQTEDNNVYYYNTNSKQKMFLFSMKISDFILIDDTVYLISEDTLFSYNETEGLKKLVIYKELGFNENNRIAIYKR